MAATQPRRLRAPIRSRGVRSLERERREWGSLERLEHQIGWEMLYSGAIDELVAIGDPRARRLRMEELVRAVEMLTRMELERLVGRRGQAKALLRGPCGVWRADAGG